MKKLFIIFGIFAFVFLIGCGSDKNKEESEKPDTGDTEAVTDTDPADTGDTEAAPDEEPAEVEDTEIVPDSDPTETDDSESWTVTQDGCTIKSSFGTHSTKRDLTESCVQKIAKAEFAICDWNYEDEEETVKHIEYLQKLVITFGQECKDNSDKIVECPDLIPESLKLGSLSGCDVYSIEPDTDCLAPCADLYFTTDNNILNSVYVGESGIRADPFIKSSDSVKEVAFSSDLKIGSNKAVFTWYEKVEDGTETEKAVSVEMKVVDSDDYTGEDFESVDVGECRHEEPAFALRDRIYTETDSYWCKEYVEVTDKTENSIRFNWFGEMHCGADWEYGYKVEGIEGNVLKVSILERDTDEIAVDCDNCCYLMPIEYTASTAEEIESVKTIEINYEGKNHKASFKIK